MLTPSYLSERGKEMLFDFRVSITPPPEKCSSCGRSCSELPSWNFEMIRNIYPYEIRMLISPDGKLQKNCRYFDCSWIEDDDLKSNYFLGTTWECKDCYYKSTNDLYIPHYPTEVQKLLDEREERSNCSKDIHNPFEVDYDGFDQFMFHHIADSDE